jgi:hypothetical protein
VGFVVDKVALGQVFFPRVLRFSPVNFIPPVLHYKEKRKRLIIFITGLHNKPQGCGASVASAAGPFTKKKVILLMFLGKKRNVNLFPPRLFSADEFSMRPHGTWLVIYMA